MSMRKRTLVLAVAATTGLTLSSGAFATNGILPIGNSMIEQGMGGAGIANAAETMSGVTNPALISNLGTQAAVGLIYFNPNRSANVGTPAGYVESDSKAFYIPSLGYVTGLGSNWSAGILVYALGGMNTDYPPKLFNPPVPTVTSNVGVDLRGYIIAPTVSYKLAPTTSIGASLLYGHAEFEASGLNQLGYAVSAKQSDSSSGWGVRLGINSEVTKGISLGAFVQPKMQMGKMDSFCNNLFQGTDCKITLPTMYGVGANFALGDNAKIVADIVQADWSGVDLYGSTSTAQSFGWKSQTIFKLGGEYSLSKALALRAGINYGKSPIPNDRVNSNILFPAISEKHVTVGTTYDFGNGLALSAFYLKALENEQTGTSPGLFGVPYKVKMDQNAVGIGLNWTMK